MEGDHEALRRINEDINKAEVDGDAEALGGLVAPHLLFRRVDGTVDDRKSFLHKVPSKAGPREIEVHTPTVYGDRAVVTCIVTQDGRRYHNLRLFVRETDGWKLLAWANEPASADPSPASVEAGVA